MIKAYEFCKRVFDGTHDTPKPTEKGYKLLTSKHIENGTLNKENAYYISKEDYEAINKRSQVKKWDILFSMIGTIGNTYLIENEPVDFAIKNIGVFSCEDEYKAKWLYFYLQSPDAKKIIQNYLNGAVQKFISLGTLRNFPISELNIKKNKIVDLLWNINKKIELNKKINSELENMAKTIYDYWFLQFEFPNEKGKPYKSSGGKMVWNEELKKEIPDGWEVTQIDSVLSVVPSTRKKLKKEYLSRGKYPVIDQSSVYISGFTDDEKAVLFLKDAVVFGDHTKIIKYINFDFCRGADGTQILLSNRENLPNILLYHQVKNLNLVSQGYSRYFKFLKEKQIILPNFEIAKQFKITSEKLYQKIRSNIFENQELTFLRDYLLPLLMNGQVGFKD